MSKFKVGQKVYDLAMGWTEIIDDKYCSEFPIRVKSLRTFLSDGRYNHSEKLPTLLTIEEAEKMNIFPPKKKVVKEVVRWINVYPNEVAVVHYATKEDADINAISDRVACVELKGSYEIEVTYD